MRYVISDIHGCYREFMELLKKIRFSGEDHLYILGDTVDRGPEPMAVLKELMKRKNVTFIIGNHDFLLHYFIKKLGFLLNPDGGSAEDRLDFKMYLEDGGLSTAEDYRRLPDEEQKAVYEYLNNASVYEEVSCGGKYYLLVHAGIAGFEEDKPLADYDFAAFITDRPDYSKRYFKDESKYIISGHTPTFFIDKDFFKSKDRQPEIYTANGHIAIDCGCAYGGRLAAYCIETGKAVYAGKTDG